MIIINGVTKKYENFVALKDVHLKIEPGSVFALVGENGSGKSTLLRVMAGVFKPESGEVLVNDTALYDNPEVKKDIIYISDAPHSSNWTDIKDLTLYYDSFYNLDKTRLEHYLNLFNVNIQKPLSKFSKGMKRRTYLAFALALAPKILLLDEAVDGLDPDGKELFKQELKALVKEKNMTAVIATQSLKDLESISDAFLILKKGEVFTSGNLSLINEEYYQYQVAFQEVKKREDFSSPLLFNVQGTGKIFTIILKGPKNECRTYLEKLNPLVSEELATTFADILKKGEM